MLEVVDPRKVTAEFYQLKVESNFSHFVMFVDANAKMRGRGQVVG